MYLVDYHTHPYAHGEKSVKPAHNFNLLHRFIDQAKITGLKELGFSDHDRFLDEMNWENLLEVRNNTEGIAIRLGLEVNYLPGLEHEIRDKISALPLDYVIGSVHCLGDWEIDHPDYRDEYNYRDIDKIYTDYFTSVKKAAASGLFDIIGHIDLVKVFGYRPEKLDISQLVKPVLEVIKQEGLVIEVNTNGLNKPVKEIYPELKILRIAYNSGVPLTFASDAHLAKRVGEKIKYAAEIIKNIGYKQIIVFDKRKKKVVKL